MWVYWLESSIELEQNFADEILIEFSRNFHLTNQHNGLQVRLSRETLDHNLFCIWICSIQINFIAIFRFGIWIKTMRFGSFESQKASASRRMKYNRNILHGPCCIVQPGGIYFICILIKQKTWSIYHYWTPYHVKSSC